MKRARVPALLTVLTGEFDTQPAAFAYLLQEAGRYGLTFDLADVDVIQSARTVRLAHYFRPAIVARIEALMGAADTVIVVRPSALTTRRDFPGSGSDLRLLGRFAGQIIEAEQDLTWP
jgi:hypothetical protein